MTALTLVEAFVIEPSRGWTLVGGSLVLIAGLYGAGVLAFRVPVLRRAQAFSRLDRRALVLVGRRGLSTSAALSAAVGRPALENAADDCFVFFANSSHLGFMSTARGAGTVLIPIEQLERVDTSRARMFTGRSDVLVLTLRAQSEPITFAVFDERTLCALTARRPRLRRLAAQIEHLSGEQTTAGTAR
ncbi:hypothetical protein [Agromyces arachidis]|uniref:hypothetical protein n=1 Tax=Agromyces arachidis TaxID=766966 RepID=UPI0040569CA4